MGAAINKSVRKENQDLKRKLEQANSLIETKSQTIQELMDKKLEFEKEIKDYKKQAHKLVSLAVTFGEYMLKVEAASWFARTFRWSKVTAVMQPAKGNLIAAKNTLKS